VRRVELAADAGAVASHYLYTHLDLGEDELELARGR